MAFSGNIFFRILGLGLGLDTSDLVDISGGKTEINEVYCGSGCFKIKYTVIRGSYLRQVLQIDKAPV